jgi:hypothetical protein
MAWITKHYERSEEWYGPLPNKRGENCGNAALKNLRLGSGGIVLQQYNPSWELRTMGYESEPEWLDVKNKRIGRPTDCPAGKSDEMRQMGMVGLYLIEDSNMSLGQFGREVDTDELQEEVVSGQRAPLKPFKPDVPMMKDTYGNK